MERLIYDKFWAVGTTLYSQRELDGLFHTSTVRYVVHP